MIQTQRALRQLHELRRHSSRMRLAAESWDAAWKTLIATLLSARTRDETTIVVAQRLFEQYPAVERLAAASVRDVARIVKPVNFYKTKSKHVVACAHALVTQHHGIPPAHFASLLILPGVGRKTANVFLSEQGKQAIGVDTHVSYISQTLGWTKSRMPHQIETDLKQLFPQKSWSSINETLVRFGKTYTSRREKDARLREIRLIQ